MWNIFQTFIVKITSVLTAAVISIGFISAPAPAPVPGPEIQNTPIANIEIGKEIPSDIEKIIERKQNNPTPIEKKQAQATTTDKKLLEVKISTEKSDQPDNSIVSIIKPAQELTMEEIKNKDKKELQEQQDHNQVSILPSVIPIRPPIMPEKCEEGDIYWTDRNNRYLNYPEFEVKVDGAKAFINIPYQLVNEKKFSVSYSLYYWKAVVPNITTDLIKVESNKLPIAADLPADYSGKMAFQLFVHSDCFVFGIKAEQNSIIFLEL